MFKLERRPAPSQNELLSVMQYHGSTIAVEEINGRVMFNAAQMGRSFGKQPNDWLRTQQASDLLDAMAKRKKCRLADLVNVRRGGNNPGTFFEEDIALIYAQWLSPDFYISCNFKLKELLSKKALEHAVEDQINGVYPLITEGKKGYPRKELLISVGRSYKNGYRLRHKYPNECFNIGRTACISGKLANLLLDEYKVKKAQLSLFNRQKQLS